MVNNILVSGVEEIMLGWFNLIEIVDSETDETGGISRRQVFSALF